MLLLLVRIGIPLLIDFVTAGNQYICKHVSSLTQDQYLCGGARHFQKTTLLFVGEETKRNKHVNENNSKRTYKSPMIRKNHIFY